MTDDGDATLEGSGETPPTDHQHRIGKLFGYDHAAASLIGEAHQRPAMRLQGPAVTWHLAFWPSAADPLSEDHEDRFKLSRAAWTRRLNTLVYGLQRPVFGWTPDKTLWIDRFALPGEDESRVRTPMAGARDHTEATLRLLKIHSSVISFAIQWRGVAGMVQIERHTEYATLTIALEADPSVIARGAQANAYELANAADVTLSPAGTKAALEAALAVLHTGSSDDAALRKASDFVYLRLWTAFAFDLSEEIRGIRGVSPADEAAWSRAVAEAAEIDGTDKTALNNALNAGWDTENALSRGVACGLSALEGRLPGAVFCDLRGAALAATAEEADPDALTAPPEGSVVFAAEEMRDMLHRNRPMIGAAVGGPKVGQRELAANAFLGGRCVFVGNLGSLSRRPVDEGATQKYWGDAAQDDEIKREISLLDQYSTRVSRHLFIFKQRPNPMQFGRLVERFHAVETVRLAAFRDLDHIRDAGRQLRQIGKRLEWLEAATVTNLEGPELKLFSEKVEKLSDEVANLGADATGGLAYRISRSSFYEGIFHRRLEEFNPDPIATWQPYAEFLRRRVVQTMNYISQVAVRRKNLQDRIGIQLSTVGTAGIKLNTEAILQVNRSIARLAKREVRLEQRAEQSRKATDRLSQIAAVLGAATLGANLGADYFDFITDVPGKIEGAVIGSVLGFLVAGLIRLVRPEPVRQDTDDETPEGPSK